MRKLSKQEFAIYGVGIAILSLGIALTIKSHLGTSPFDALLVGLSNNVGFTVGSWEIIIALILIVVNSILGKRRPEFLGLITAIITGIGIDFWLFFFGVYSIPEILIVRIVTFVVGLIFIGLGTAVYLYVNFAATPLDHFMLLIREIAKISISTSKTLQYLLFIILAFIFHGPIGVGTVVTLFLGGPILNIFMPIVTKRLDLLIVQNHTSNHQKFS